MKRVIGIVLGICVITAMMSVIVFGNKYGSVIHADVVRLATESTYVPMPDKGSYSISLRKKKYKMGIKDNVRVIIKEIKDDDVVISDPAKIAEIIDEGEVAFKSRNTKIATVSSKGVIKAKAEGTANIMVAYGKF